MRISLRAQKLAYTAATCGCLAATVAATTFALRPTNLVRDNQAKSGTSSANVTPKSDGPLLPSREDVAKLCDRPLRQQLYDPPPPKVEIKPLPPLRVELLGTIIEESNSMALVRSETGSVEYKRVGDVVGPIESPAKLVTIDADTITVERATERVTLKVNNKNLQ